MNRTTLYLYLSSILTSVSSLFAMELPVAHSITQSSAYTTASITPFSNSQSIKTDEILVNTNNELEQALTIINGLYKKIEHLNTQKNLDIDALIKQFAYDNCKTEINLGLLKKIFDRLITKSPNANCSWYRLGALVLYNARTNENHEYAYQCFHNTNPDRLDKLDKIKLAQFLQQLGKNYFSGQFGCEQNDTKAHKCFEKAEQTDEILVNTHNELEQALTLINALYKKIEHLSTQKNLDIDALIKQFAYDNCKTEINLGILKKIFDLLITKSPNANCSWYHLGALVLYNARTNENHEYAYQCFQNTNPDRLDKLDKIKLAQFLQQLGKNYFSGQFGCEQNDTKAHKCFEKVEQLVVPDYDKTFIWCYLGIMYFLGHNAEINLPLAMQYLLRIPDQNILSPESKECLAECLESIGENYFLGQDGCEQNYDKARKCFEKVEQLDIPDYDKTITWYHLGAIYYCGHNVPINLPIAEKYLLKIPNQNILCSADKKLLAYWLEKIGDTYYFGQENSCEQNYMKARQCFEKVEQLDIPGYDKTPTWYYLGAMFILGQNVEINLHRAREYFLKIPDQNILTPGPKQALALWLESIGEKYSSGQNSCELNPTKARECFEKVTRLNVPGYPRFNRTRN